MHKLDVAAVSRRIFGVLLDGPFLGRAAGAWFALFTVIGWVNLAVERWTADGAVAPFIDSIVKILAGVVEVTGFAACAVNVHRHVLLAENPEPLRVGRTEWRYFWRGIWVFLPIILFVVALVVAPVIFPLTGISDIVGGVKRALAEPGWSYGRALVWLGSEMAAGVVLVPLYMSLPAVAIGRGDFTMSDGIDAIPGNFLRLLAVFLIACALPVTAVGLIAEGIENGISIVTVEPAFLFKASEIAVEAGRGLLDVVIWAAMLSCAYAELVERNRDLIIPPQDADA